MTLVVARISKNRLSIAADTLISKHEKSLPLSDGVIKSYILPNNLCVSFCNSPELADRAFRRYLDMYPSGTNFVESVSFFETSSRETGNDYLLAFGAPCKIVKIVDGFRRLSVSSTQWIGDEAAFKKFRAYELDHKKRYHHGRAVNGVLFADELDGSPASDLYSIMRNFIQEGGQKSVGGFISVVSFRDIGFRFAAFCDVLFDWPLLLENDKLLAYSDKLQLQVSGENLDYSISQITFRAINLNIVGFYMLKGKLLYLFHGENNGLAQQCATISGVPPLGITPAINSFFGRDMAPRFQVLSAAPSERPLNTKQSDGVGLALYCEANGFPKQPDRDVEVIKGLMPKNS